MASTTFPALRFEQSGHVLYVGYAPAEKLLRFTKIDRFDPDLALEDPEQGYQRIPEHGRISRLANYLVRKEGEGLLPTAVLLASHHPVEFVGSSAAGTIVVDDDDDNLLRIVDGQTRLLGIQHAINERKESGLAAFELPFVLLDDVDRMTEMSQFKIVNGEVKSVRTDLVNMILTQLAKEQGDATIKSGDRWKVVAAGVVERLNGTDGGPWQDMIVLPNATAYPKAEILADPTLEHRRLARATSFMTSIKPVYDWLRDNYFTANDLESESEGLANILTAYWQAIEELVPDAFASRNEYVIQKTPGIFALHMLLTKPILRDMFKARRPFVKEDFKVMLEPIPEMTDAKYWHSAERRASTYGSMRGFSELAEALRGSLR